MASIVLGNQSSFDGSTLPSAQESRESVHSLYIIIILFLWGGGGGGGGV